MDGKLDSEKLLGSLKYTDALYCMVNFINEAIFGLLQNAAMKVPDHSSLTIKKCVTEYK